MRQFFLFLRGKRNSLILIVEEQQNKSDETLPSLKIPFLIQKADTFCKNTCAAASPCRRYLQLSPPRRQEYESAASIHQAYYFRLLRIAAFTASSSRCRADGAPVARHPAPDFSRFRIPAYRRTRPSSGYAAAPPAVPSASGTAASHL